MKVIIAGSRTIRDYNHVLAAIKDSGFEITEVVCGMAQGPDLFGRFWAKTKRPSVEVREFPADWQRLGRRAGFARNCQMADYADALIAVWDGQSGGTRHMIHEARRRGLKVFVKEVLG